MGCTTNKQFWRAFSLQSSVVYGALNILNVYQADQSPKTNFCYQAKFFICFYTYYVDLLLDFEVDRIGILPLNKVYLGVLRVIWG